MSLLTAPPLSPKRNNYDAGYLNFADVMREEQECIKGQCGRRQSDGKPEASLSVAFSGGGIRAAAFQAGVLWRLAEENRLKDIDYLAAVSGGGYIASAFATHCLGPDLPKEGSVKAWYLEAVAKTLCRIQNNCGNFVRDCVKNPGCPKDGAGYLPRILDLPVLVLVLLFTLIVVPLFFIVSVLIPLIIAMELYFGSAMRASFCRILEDDETMFQQIFDLHDYFRDDTPWLEVCGAFMLCLVVTVLVQFISHISPCCRLRPAHKHDQRPAVTPVYLFGHALRGCLRRFTVIFLLILALPWSVAAMTVLVYTPEQQSELCLKFATDQRNTSAQVLPDCAYHDGRVQWWENNHTYMLLRAKHQRQMHMVGSKNVMRNFNISTKILECFGVLLSFAVFIMPFTGSRLLMQVFEIAGPMWMFVGIMNLVRFRVYGPLHDSIDGFYPWSQYTWDKMVQGSLLATILTLPFIGEFRSSWHTYYRMSLRDNLFRKGEDVTFAELKENPYCPFVLLTGTACDFQPPGDTDVIAEISFSALHCGGEETGYVQQYEHRLLSTCTAISGAGCLDAISLAMTDLISLRFWLEASNLSWGEYVVFKPTTWYFILGNWGCLRRRGRVIIEKLYTLPAVLPWLILYILFWVGYHHMRTAASACRAARVHFNAGIGIAGAVLMLSFFSNIPGVPFFTHSLFVRRFHQITRYFYKGRHPPPMLYITDGGTKDCTALMQLLMRQRERILLVLAAGDPRDELGVLKTTMQLAKSLKVATFYDPDDPRRDPELIFDRFREDRDEMTEMPYLHLGISYCYSSAPPHTGQLFIVKNRLPTCCCGKPVRHLLSEEEIRQDSTHTSDDSSGSELSWLDIDELGVCGCCDCCHENGMNCGPKFPHGNWTGYLWLSPHWCSSLMRLGYEASAQAVEDMMRSTPSKWENNVEAVR